MECLKRLYRKYMQGAKSNIFPIKQCGLFGGKLKRPRNLNEAVVALGYIVNEEDKEIFQEWSEEEFAPRLHHSLGRLIRNEWGLWDETSKLHKWFKGRGIWHADDMSGIILTTYYRMTHSLPIKLNKQIQAYKEYWRKEDLKESSYENAI